MKRTKYQKWRDGWDWSAILIILIFVCVIIAGVLERNGKLNFIP